MHGLRVERFERVEKRHVLARAARIMQRPRPIERDELLRHAPDRRDADAAGNQHHVLGILDQRKIIARRADLDLIADLHFLDDVARAAAAGGVLLDADDVAVGIVIGYDQRKLTHQAVGQMQIDMGAWLIGRQRAALDAGKCVELGVAGDVLDLGQSRVDKMRVRLRQMRAARRGGRGCDGIHAGDK